MDAPQVHAFFKELRTMFDAQAADAIFDASMQAFGAPPGSDLMNPKVLLPLRDLPRYVQQETGKALPPKDLEEMARAGWFRMGQTAGEDGDEPGVLLVVPSRIGLLLDLQSAGWAPEELSVVARYEDEMIDWVFTTDELAYEDSPTATLARFYEEEALMFEEEARRAIDGKWNNLETIFRTRGLDTQINGESAMELASRWRLRADRYRHLDLDDLSPERREKVLRLAFHVALRNDTIRMMLLDSDRVRVRQGYSPFLVFGHQSFGPDGQHELGDIIWGSTVRSPWLLEQEVPSVRLPGLVLRGTKVELTGSPSPSEYERLFRLYDVRAYLSEWAAVTDARVCQHCFAALPAEADARRKYCGDGCRNAAKQARYRERYPSRVFDSQARYYRQFDSD